MNREGIVMEKLSDYPRTKITVDFADGVKREYTILS